MCARVWQVLPEGQLRAGGRAVPVCRQHQPVHEHHRAARQHLRLRAQPPGRSGRRGGVSSLERGISSVIRVHSEQSILQTFSLPISTNVFS